MRRDPFLESVLAAIKRWDMLRDGDEVVVGVSGGPDSVALLRALCWFRDRRKMLCWIVVAHLNHMLRGKEAEQDAEFVKRLAARLRCLCFDGKVDVRSLAAERGLSIEEAAREARYTYLQQTCMAVSENKLALGHTSDDQVETVLHRLIRGAGVAGLSGMAPKRRLSENSPIEIIRPLLGTRRRDVETFLRRQHQKFRVDSSNLSSRYFRNRLRNELLPLLEAEYNSNIRGAVAGLSSACRDAADFLSQTAQQKFEDLSVKHHAGGVVIPIPKLRDVHPAVLPMVIRLVLQTMGIGLKQITREHYAAVGRLISEKAGEKKASLPYGLYAIRSGESLRIERRAVEPKKLPAPIRLAVPGITAAPGTDILLSAEVLEGGMGLLEAFRPFKNRYEEMLDFDKLAPPLTVRRRRPGERFWPLGARGARKLQDFMVDQKIPREERSGVPVVADRRHAIWVVGYRIDHRARITSATKRVLKLTAELQGEAAP